MIFLIGVYRLRSVDWYTMYITI